MRLDTKATKMTSGQQAAEEAGKEQDDDNHLREKIVPAIPTTEIRDLKVSLCHLKTATADELVLTKHQTLA